MSRAYLTALLVCFLSVATAEDNVVDASLFGSWILESAVKPYEGKFQETNGKLFLVVEAAKFTLLGKAHDAVSVKTTVASGGTVATLIFYDEVKECIVLTPLEVKASKKNYLVIQHMAKNAEGKMKEDYKVLAYKK